MTSSWLSHDLGTIYIPGTKWGLDLISQVLQALLSTNYLRCVRLAKKIDKRHHHEYHVIWLQFTDLMQNEDQIWYLKFHIHHCLQTLSDMVGGNKRISSMMPSYLSGGFGTICRSGIPNKDQSWYLRFHIHHHLQTFLGILGWQKNFISDIFIVVTWLCYNLQTMCKMRSRYSISSSTYTIAFKLCQISWENKRISLKM